MSCIYAIVLALGVIHKRRPQVRGGQVRGSQVKGGVKKMRTWGCAGVDQAKPKVDIHIWFKI